MVACRVTSLPPIVDGGTVALVLGSVPSTISIETGQYYANPRNLFWRTVHQLFGGAPSPRYEERVGFILGKGIGLWDVIGECTRDNSRDASIRDVVINDLGALFTSYPGIRCVFFNGAKAKEMFDARARLDPARLASIRFELLPSTSPANTGIGPTEKMERWRAIRRCLDAAEAHRTGH